MTDTVSPSRRTAVAFWPVRMSTPCSFSDSVTSSQANSSSRGSSRRSPSISVISAPSEQYAWLISAPTTPPPITIRLAGTCFAVVASRFVHGLASARPSIGGSAGVVPPARKTARRTSIVSSPTTTRFSPSSRPQPR